MCPRTDIDDRDAHDFVSTRRISVQSSFRLKLPPPLIVEASSIKVADPIGQGSILLGITLFQIIPYESLGEFGIVYKGQLMRTTGRFSQSEIVAIKTLKGKCEMS